MVPFRFAVVEVLDWYWYRTALSVWPFPGTGDGFAMLPPRLARVLYPLSRMILLIDSTSSCCPPTFPGRHRRCSSEVTPFFFSSTTNEVVDHHKHYNGKNRLFLFLRVDTRTRNNFTSMWITLTFLFSRLSYLVIRIVSCWETNKTNDRTILLILKLKPKKSFIAENDYQ